MEAFIFSPETFEKLQKIGAVLYRIVDTINGNDQTIACKKILAYELDLGDKLQVRILKKPFDKFARDGFSFNTRNESWHITQIVSNKFVDNDAKLLIHGLVNSLVKININVFAGAFTTALNPIVDLLPKDGLDDAHQEQNDAHMSEHQALDANEFMAPPDEVPPPTKTFEHNGDELANWAEQLQPKKMKSSGKESKVEALFSLNLPVSELISNAVNDFIEREDVLKNVRNHIIAEAKKLRPTLIQIGDRPKIEVMGRRHIMFESVLDALIVEGRAMLVGPTGTGKTTLAQQISEVFNVPFGHLSCTAGMSEGHILGRMNADGEYLESSFVKCYENGGVFLFDEIDASDPNTLLIINSALVNGMMSVPNRVKKNYATKHKDFYVICAANTYGLGSTAYSGRARLDDAFLDRFSTCKVFVDYDTSLEKEIAGEKYQKELAVLHAIRENITKTKIRRPLSTRIIEGMVKRMMTGKKLHQFLDIFFLGWTPEEQAKAMQGVVLPK